MPRVVWIVKMRSYRVAALYIRCRVTWWPKLHSSLLQIAYTSRCLLWIIFLGKWIAKGRLFYFSLLKHQHGFMMKWLQNGFTQLIMNVKRLGSSNTFTRNWEWTRTDSRPTFGCLYHPLNMFMKSLLLFCHKGGYSCTFEINVNVFEASIFFVFINNVARGAVQFDFLLQKSRKLVTRDVSIFNYWPPFQDAARCRRCDKYPSIYRIACIGDESEARLMVWTVKGNI